MERSGGRIVWKPTAALLAAQPSALRQGPNIQFVLPNVSLCCGPLHGLELDAVDIPEEGITDNRIFEHKASLACKPLCKHSLILLARREPLLS